MKSITNLPIVPRIEYVISAHLRPTFLAITNPEDDENGDIQIVVSAHQFSYMTVPQRVTHVFSILNKHLPEVLQNRLIIVTPYDTIEMEEIINDIFNKEMFR